MYTNKCNESTIIVIFVSKKYLLNSLVYTEFFSLVLYCEPILERLGTTDVIENDDKQSMLKNNLDWN